MTYWLCNYLVAHSWGTRESNELKHLNDKTNLGVKEPVEIIVRLLRFPIAVAIAMTVQIECRVEPHR